MVLLVCFKHGSCICIKFVEEKSSSAAVDTSWKKRQ